MAASDLQNQVHQTPMMRQWYDLKAKAGNALLFFRLGDFYELFEEDAIKAAPLLGIALTSRNHRNAEGPEIPLCGVPIAHLESYLPKVLDKGLKVALVEQLEDPKPGKSIVKRGIVQWFTPGIRLMRIDERPHYLGVVCASSKGWIAAAADIGTGHVVVENIDDELSLDDWLKQWPVEDLRYVGTKKPETNVIYQESTMLITPSEAETEILQSLGLSDRADLPLEGKTQLQTLGTLFRILREAHPNHQLHFARPKENQSLAWTTSATRKNLHLLEPEDHSLFRMMDRTQTASGRRVLKEFLSHPLYDSKEIQKRQSMVRLFKEDPTVRSILRTKLRGILDFNRLLRIRRGPEELFRISQSLSQGLSVARALPNKHHFLSHFKNISDGLQNLSDELDRCLIFSESSEWGWIKTGVNSTLDELRNFKVAAGSHLSQLEIRLREDYGISNLKVKFHQVFGYVIEITSAHKNKIPDNIKRVQTLANAERYKNEELEKLEVQILSLESRIQQAESAEIKRLYDYLEQFRSEILEWASILSEVDVYLSLAQISSEESWITPQMSDGAGMISLQGAIHPLVRGNFVPLNLEMNSELQVILLTGPNMSGKSTVLRTAALMTWLHQIGSDIPAQSATLSLFDRIVCRMGAADDLTTGQSTFYYEMKEVSSNLKGASERSLLLFDEIGRGTSTFDGMSLAWSITEYVHQIEALCFMATHYLELASLQKRLHRLQCFHLGVEERDGQLVFTRQLLNGPASRSYGIQVARLAQLPDSILKRAEEKLAEFEKKRERSLPLFAYHEDRELSQSR